MYRSIILASALAAAVRAQQVGTAQAEVHPALTWSKCAAGGACTTQQGQVTIDANWRWTHNAQEINCYTGNTWNATLCPDDVTCAANCAIDGAEYQSTYGVTTSGNALTLDFVTQTSSGPNVGSRLYLMDTETHYAQFDLLNNEFTFDVDVSQLPCGLNGALYFVSMDADGGVAKFPANKAGAKYGTGYCDSQCPRDLKFIQGAANSQGWVPASNNINTGIGNFGSCCAEMDIWEANSMANAVTPHPCTTATETKCTTSACGGTDSNATRFDSVCDPDGCDFNPFRQGNETFFGPGKTIDTTKVFTVVTQFVGNPLTAIKRFYVQNGKVFAQPDSTIAGVTGNEITEAYCDAQKAAFGDETSFQTKGGMSAMSTAMAGGMTLVLSLWDDYAADMLWLDSTYPTTKLSPGGPRGSCATTSGVPAQVEAQSPNARVIYSNIKFGPINSTFSSTGAQPPSGGSSPTSVGAPAPTAAGTVPEFGQCGGQGFTGATTCVAPFTCQELNPFFFQCLTA